MCLSVCVFFRVEVNNLLAIFYLFQKNFSKTIFALCLGYANRRGLNGGRQSMALCRAVRLPLELGELKNYVLFFELEIKLVSTGNSRRERSD